MENIIAKTKWLGTIHKCHTKIGSPPSERKMSALHKCENFCWQIRYKMYKIGIYEVTPPNHALYTTFQF